VLDPSGSIEFPPLDDSDESNRFHWRYMNFFAGKEAVPVYRNITDEYADVILDEKTRSAPDRMMASADAAPVEAVMAVPDLSEADIPSEDVMPEALMSEEERPEPVGEDRAAAPMESPAPAPVQSRAKAPALTSSLRSKEAEGLFQTDPEVQERVYDLAASEGQQYLERNVLPQMTVEPREEATQTVVRSVYMESTRYFEEILSEGEYGLIPRLFDSTFMLLFWARRGDRIVGCELNMDLVRDGLAGAIATPADSVRLLNILDSSGEPLIPFPDRGREEWRRPFVAKEISQWLPYWETAILLRDPEEFQRQLDSSRYLLTFMISALSLLLLGAMILIYHLSSRQLKEVQQRVGFVTNVTHELKTPLTSIRLYSEMLSGGYGQDREKVEKYSRYIASESQRLTRLIGHVLDFAKWDRGSAKLSRESLDLNEMAGEVCRGVAEEYEQDGFVLAFVPCPGPLPLTGDREALVQVLLNLLSNARKYSDGEREITVATESKDREIRLSVSDRGIGIPRKYRRKVFREFYRVDTSLTSRYKGTGLGLAIAARIMKNHGGRLVCAPRDRNNYRRGSRFTMVFPRGGKKGEGR